MSAWGTNHRVDKRSLLGSTGSIFSHVKVKHCDKYVAAIAGTPHCCCCQPGAVTRTPDKNTPTVAPDFGLGGNCHYSVCFGNSLPAQLHSEAAEPQAHSTKGSSAPISLLLPLFLLLHFHGLNSPSPPWASANSTEQVF